MQFEILHPRDLADADAASWRSLARAHPDTSTPFLGPDYARLVADCGGPDAARARVLVIREKGEAVGFMAYRKGRLGACAIGAPFTDYQGLVAAPGLGLTQEELVGALKVGRLDFTGVPSTQALFCDHFREHDESLLALLPDGYEAFSKDRKAAGTDVLPEAARKKRKLVREVGEVTFEACRQEGAALELLFDWKSRQFRETGQPDVLAPQWPRTLMRRLAQSPDPGCRAEIFALKVEGRTIAVNLSLRGETSLHAWVIAHDAEFHRYSPGALLFDEILRWMPQERLTELDFGPCSYPFKVRLSNGRRKVGVGYLGRPSVASAVSGLAWGLREAAEKAPLGRVSHWPAKAMRRLERFSTLHGV